MSAALEVPQSRRYRPATSHRERKLSRFRLPSTRPPATIAEAQPAVRRAPSGDTVLDVQNLKTYFFTYEGVVRALDGVNLAVRRGETTGIVGETGCGKSVTAFSIARLVSEPGRVMSGKIFFHGANLLWGLEKEAKYRRHPKTGRIKVVRSFRRIKAANERLSSVRGRGIGMIFQEPSQAMNPVFSISNQLGETVLLHRGVEVLEGLLKADLAWRQVRGITAPEAGGDSEVGEAGPAVQHPRSTSALVDALVEAGETGDQAATRAAARALAADLSLPTIEPEAFYLVRSAGAEAKRFRYRVVRAVRRISLTPWQRQYLRYRRRVLLLERELNDLFFREMRLGKSQAVARSRVRLRLRFERLRNLHFGLWGVRQRVEKPLKTELFWRTVEMLEGVRIANPVQVARGYPHELSGGMLQRAMIAMALSAEPDLLLADEPTTALDVTIQAQILDLMRQLRDRVGTSIVLITHDLGVVAEVCDRVNVMYAGLIVETARADELFRRPLHPYTQGLLSSIPRFDQPDKELSSIPGSVPNLVHPPPGCRFHPRCPYAMPICKEVRPESLPQGEDHFVACHLYTAPPEAPLPMAGEPAAT